LTNPNDSVVHIRVPQSNINIRLTEGQSTTLTNLQVNDVRPYISDFKLILEDLSVVEAREKEEEAAAKLAADEKIKAEQEAKLEADKKAADAKRLADEKAAAEAKKLADKKAADEKAAADKKLADDKAAADAKAKSEESK
jgi:hypothetical protein